MKTYNRPKITEKNFFEHMDTVEKYLYWLRKTRRLIFFDLDVLLESLDLHQVFHPRIRK